MKLNWNFLGEGEAKQKPSVGGGDGYFLELHNLITRNLAFTLNLSSVMTINSTYF